MLRNPAYAGTAVFGKTRAVHEPAGLNRTARLAGRTVPRQVRTQDRPREEWTGIPVPALVDEETFDRVQQRLADNKRFASRNTKVPSLLQGIAACASCGYGYYRTTTTTTAGNKIYYYRCLGSDDYRYQGGRVCQNKPVRADYADQVVWDHVTALLADPALIRAEIGKRLERARTSDPVTRKRGQLEQALAKTSTSIAAMVTAFSEQLITIDELRARMPALRARETGLKDQIAALDAQAADRDAYLKLADDLEGFLAGLRGAPPPPPPRTASASCAPSSRTSSSDPRNSPSATASPSGNHPAAAATTTQPTRRVTCAKVRCCVGGVASPVLSNIYLDKLDKFVEQELIPQYTRGETRARNPAYIRVKGQLRGARRAGDRAGARELTRQMRSLPSKDPMDPGFRRLRYTRYADDHLLGFTGPKAEAEEIKARLAKFLRETLRLELNQDKTMITHARDGAARFLGYDITVQHCNTKITGGQRSANGKIALRVPADVVKAQCALYRHRGKPWHRPRLQNLPDYDIVRIYGAEYRGVVNYYLPAQNVWWLHTLRWHAETSMLKTLAAKHHSTVTAMASRYKAKVTTGSGPRTCFEARLKRNGKQDLVARFGGIILRQDRRAVITDPAPVTAHHPRKELVHRLRKRRCELCEQGTTVAVHQVSSLSKLGRPGKGQPAWAALMAKKRRKTLIVCAPCHEHIHANPVIQTA